MAQPLSKSASTFSREDWAGIAQNPKFRELHKRKTAFLFGWWIFSTAYYFALPLLVGAAPGFMNIEAIGNVTVGYLFAISQYLMCWGIAIYYAFWANSTSDRLTRELLEDLKLR